MRCVICLGGRASRRCCRCTAYYHHKCITAAIDRSPCAVFECGVCRSAAYSAVHRRWGVSRWSDALRRERDAANLRAMWCEQRAHAASTHLACVIVLNVVALAVVHCAAWATSPSVAAAIVTLAVGVDWAMMRASPYDAMRRTAHVAAVFAVVVVASGCTVPPYHAIMMYFIVQGYLGRFVVDE
jgi:hypothetical protein